MPPAAALRPLVRATVGAALACGALAAPAVAAPAKPAKPTPEPTLAPLPAQELKVRGLSRERHRPAYAEGLVALAQLKRQAGDRRGALNAAREAADAFDTLVDLHKTISDGQTSYDVARAERAMALTLGLKRDEANFLAAEIAAELGDEDVAIKRYIMVIQSQGDQPKGQAAYEALRRLGGPVPPVPPVPSGSPRP